MGKPGGFLDFKRRDPGYRDVAERVQDYNPVELHLAEADLQAQAARCMNCGIPFCHASGCPLGNVIPEVNHLVYEDRWEEALDLLLATDNFPEFTGRVCPALCEPACVLGINDDAVAIRQIELAVIETGFARGYLRPRPPAQRLDRHVAVIGSGPAGLAVADVLNHVGCLVTVYDEAPQAGGILRYGIPDFKLEKSVLDRRLRLMEAEGVEFVLGLQVGEDISYKYLQKKFHAICLAVGARAPRDLAVPGRGLAGVHLAMDYLVGQNMRLAGEPLDPVMDITAQSKTVVVIGGGDTGSDCVGTAIRQGARKVTQLEILPQPPDTRPAATPWPMWPNILRKSSSHMEGGARRWAVNTRELIGRAGRVAGLRGIGVEWHRDAGGKMVMTEKPGTEFEIEADLVLLALGFSGPSQNKIFEDLQLARDARGNLKVDARRMTSSAGVFAAGDSACGQSLVVRAMADGRAAAQGIIAYLGVDPQNR